MDHAYYHLLEHMDNGTSRFAKFKKKKIDITISAPKHCDVSQIHQSKDECFTATDVKDFRDEYKKLVLKKGRATPSSVELSAVRDYMRQLYSSEQDIFSRFQTYFDEKNPQYAAKFKCMLNNVHDPAIKWMTESLIPFGEHLQSWCDSGDSLAKSLYSCNGR